MSSTASSLKVALRSIAGLALGALFLWLVARNVVLTDVRKLLSDVDVAWLAAALGVYVIALAVRTLRWRRLLPVRSPRFSLVAFALLVGFAVNNLVPARLGEIYRAHLAGRLLSVSRTACFASIVVERVMDGMTVVAFLAVGLLAVPSSHVTTTVLVLSAALFGGAMVCLALLHRISAIPFVSRSPRAREILANFQNGLVGITRAQIGWAALLSILVWCLEALMIALVLRGFGVVLAPLSMAFVVALVSLMTLLPSAPAFVGTYQFAFAFALGVLGQDDAVGLVAATAVQVAVLAPVTISGMSLLLLARLRNVASATSRMTGRGE